MAPARKQGEIAALGALLLLAAGLRLHALGALGFSGPEDYVVLAARGILAHGVPEFPSGAHYVRALPYSYATAVLVGVFGESEFSVRLLGALLSTLSVGLVYGLARGFGPAVALVAAGVMALSPLEITLGRTARMYGPFSFFALLGIWSLVRAVYDGDRRYRIPTLIAFAIASLLHEAAATLLLPVAALLVFPDVRARRPGFVVLCGALLVVAWLAVGALTDHFYEHVLRLVAESAGAWDVGAASREGVLWSDHFALVASSSRSLGLGPAAWLAAAAGIAAGAAIFARWLAGPGLVLPLATFATVAALSLHQTMGALYLASGFALLAFFRPGVARRDASLALLTLVGLGAGAWFVVWMRAADPPALGTLIGYPKNFLLHYVKWSPAMAVVVLLAALEMLRRYRDAQHDSRGLFVVAAMLLPAAGMGLHSDAYTRFHERYAYFLNPYFVIVYAWGIVWLAAMATRKLRSNGRSLPRLGPVLVAGCLLVLTGGLDPRAAIAAATPHYGPNERLRESSGKARVYPDCAGPSRFVCAQAGARDVIVVTDLLGHYLYCPRVHYHLTIEDTVDAEGWIGSVRTLRSLRELRALSAAGASERFWLVVSQEEVRRRSNLGKLDELQALLRTECVQMEQAGRDGVSAVYSWTGRCLDSSPLGRD